MPVADPQAFVFTYGGPAGPRAHSLKELVALLESLPEDQISSHLQRHDFLRWLEQVFLDCSLATFVRALESRVAVDRARDMANDIAQAVRARYEMAPEVD